MNHNYAREKLALLLRDLDYYTADEFWRQMSRIASGATGQAHAEELLRLATNRGEQRAALAAYSGELRQAGEAIRHELAQWSLTERDPETSSAMCNFDHIAREAPATSLARRDARVVADALDNLLGVVRCSGNRYLIDTVETNISHLRRQAEPGD